MTGPLLFGAAVLAGMVSATSPCILPVIPGYLAAVSPAITSEHPNGQRSLRGAAGFVLGFAIVFTALGATASAFGVLLFRYLDRLLLIAGSLLILLGLHTLGLLRLRRLDRERRAIPLLPTAGGRRRAVVLGAVFALGWTPCIGPILATILTQAAVGASLAQGMALLALYSLGLGIPFLALAAWFERSARPRGWFRRHAYTIERFGGIVMVLAGIAYISGTWASLFQGLQRQLAGLGWPPI